MGECYQSYLENYPDEIDELLLQKKYDNLFNSGNFVPAVFLCEDTDYELTDEDLLITIDKSLIENLYHDFNETRNDCFITTKRIPPKAILSIISIQYDENENEIKKKFFTKNDNNLRLP